MRVHTLCHTPFLLLSMRHESCFPVAPAFMLASPRQSTFPFPQRHGVGLIKPLRVPMLRVPMLRVPMLRAWARCWSIPAWWLSDFRFVAHFSQENE